MNKQVKEKAFVGDGLQGYSTKVKWFEWNRNEKDPVNWKRTVELAVERLNKTSPDLVKKFRNLAKKTEELFPNKPEVKAELLCWLVEWDAVSGNRIYRHAIEILHDIAMQKKAKGRLEKAFLKVEKMREDYGAGYFLMYVGMDLVEMLPLAEQPKHRRSGNGMGRNSIAD